MAIDLADTRQRLGISSVRGSAMLFTCDEIEAMAAEIERLRNALTEIEQAMSGAGSLSRDDDADTLDQIGMCARRALQPSN